MERNTLITAGSHSDHIAVFGGRLANFNFEDPTKQNALNILMAANISNIDTFTRLNKMILTDDPVQIEKALEEIKQLKMRQIHPFAKLEN